MFSHCITVLLAQRYVFQRYQHFQLGVLLIDIHGTELIAIYVADCSHIQHYTIYITLSLQVL